MRPHKQSEVAHCEWLIVRAKQPRIDLRIERAGQLGSDRCLTGTDLATDVIVVQVHHGDDVTATGAVAYAVERVDEVASEVHSVVDVVRAPTVRPPLCVHQPLLAARHE